MNVARLKALAHLTRQNEKFQNRRMSIIHKKMSEDNKVEELNPSKLGTRE